MQLTSRQLLQPVLGMRSRPVRAQEVFRHSRHCVPRPGTRGELCVACPRKMINCPVLVVWIAIAFRLHAVYALQSFIRIRFFFT